MTTGLYVILSGSEESLLLLRINGLTLTAQNESLLLFLSRVWLPVSDRKWLHPLAFSEAKFVAPAEAGAVRP